jgi:hypothetical protein
MEALEDRRQLARPQYFPAQLFRSGGSVQGIPNPYDAQIIGWIEGNDVVVTTGVGSTGLAVTRAQAIVAQVEHPPT